jgi:lipopolysaccharide transport system ATP-binding protein
MSDIAIRVEKLSKRYRIGKSDSHRNGPRSLLSRLAAPFNYLASTLREPSADEIIWALNGVSFEVKRGEAIGIIGRNGAGKSTLLKILSRITDPTEGYSIIYGRVGSLLEVGTGFHPELTGRENIYLNGAILGMKRAEIERRFDEIVAFAGIEKFLDTPVKRYSSGMYVRLAFAVAAHLESEILVMDEVLAVGDATFQKKCLGKMGDVARGGRTVLFVSHNMAAVAQLCQRTIWLDGGQIKLVGSSGQMVQAYLSTSGQHRPERQWSYPGDAPGDDRVRLLACRILQAGKVAPVVDINQPCQIEIEFQVLQPANNLISGVSLYLLSFLQKVPSACWSN